MGQRIMSRTSLPPQLRKRGLEIESNKIREQLLNPSSTESVNSERATYLRERLNQLIQERRDIDGNS
jgi:hypothetical protein